MFWLPGRSAGSRHRQTYKNMKPNKAKMLSPLADVAELILRTNTMNSKDEHHEFRPEWRTPKLSALATLFDKLFCYTVLKTDAARLKIGAMLKLFDWCF